MIVPLGNAVSATGDPHMQNMFGQRFDLKQPGSHTLIQIPRNASVSNALLRVQAIAEQHGAACSDMYFKTINITGWWVNERQYGGYAYASDAPDEIAGWQSFGKVDIKISWGHTKAAVTYLNFFVRHLKNTGYDIGGLLGMDDYRLAAKASITCEDVVQLHSTSGNLARDMSMAAAYM